MIDNGHPVDLTPFAHLYPFKSNYMEINGLKYHYVDEGEGEPVIMIHGNPTWSFYYRHFIKALSPSFRTIVPDHIGCGLSDKPDASQYNYTLKNRVDDFDLFIQTLNIKQKLTLMVHDWGGMIGFTYALRHPDRIGRLIITNTSGFFTPGDKGIPLRLRVIRHITPFATLAVLGLNIFSGSALYMAPHKRLSKDAKAGLKAPYNCWKNRIATLKFVQDIPVKASDPSYSIVKHTQDNLHRLADIPKLFLWGEHDFVFTPAFLDEFRRRFPDAQFHQFMDAGHYINEDIPEKMTPIVKTFLDKHKI